MTQPGFEFTPAPIRGRTPRARHASRTGAVQAGKTWDLKRDLIVRVLQVGPRSRQGLADLTGIRINAICSLVESLLGQKVIKKADDYESVTWPDGSITRREQFQIRERP